jgi:hypothetical protein
MHLASIHAVLMLYGMEVAGEAGDETSADMLLAIHTTLEQHVWMLSAFFSMGFYYIYRYFKNALSIHTCCSNVV